MLTAIESGHPYFYELKASDGTPHSQASGTVKRALMRQLKKQMRGFDGTCKADYFLNLGNGKTKLIGQLEKDEDGNIHYREL